MGSFRPSARPATPIPAGAQTIDLTGKECDPRPGHGARAPLLPERSRRLRTARRIFSRLYLSGGVTTMRTGGNVNGFMDLEQMMRLVVRPGQKPGPAIDATAPYLNGPNTFIQMRTLKDPRTRAASACLTDEGATSLKTYMQITRGGARRRDQRGASPRHQGHRDISARSPTRRPPTSASTISSTASSHRRISSPTRTG